MLKKMTVTLVFIGVCIASFFLLKPTPQTPAHPIHLPWDIESLNDGRSTVFGLTIESTTLGEAIDLLGNDHELAVIADKNSPSSLEMYFSHFSAGPLKAKLIVVVDATDDFLDDIQQNPANIKLMASGASQFFLTESQIQNAMSLSVNSLSLIPAVNLKKEIIIERFGEPDSIIQENEGTAHLLYPKLGLDIILNEEAKEQLMYVAPRSFDLVTEPLKDL